MKRWIVKNRKLLIVIIIAIIVFVYFIVNKVSNDSAETRYILGDVHRGTIVTSVSGTGQVSALNQIDLTSKISGDLVYLNAKVGQAVNAGGLIAEIDSRDAYFELESARISYSKFLKDSANSSIDKKDALNQTEISVEDSYQNARSTLSSAITDMSDVLSGIEDILNGYLGSNNSNSFTNTEKEYTGKAETAYYTSNRLLTDFLKTYSKVSDSTSDSEIESLISNSNIIANEVSQATKFTRDAVAYLRDREDKIQTEAENAYTEINQLLAKANSTVSDTISAKNSIINSERALRNAKNDFENVKDGPDTLSLRTEELALRKKEEAYRDHFIYAPFDGIIASVPVRKGDSVNSGNTIVTYITKNKIAEISLNEIDATRVKAGQKAVLTFDAIEDLTIDGEVLEVDLVGTVSQGVVNYNVKIGFDMEDERVKSGMTVSATIITDKRDNVVTVPTSAVKTIRNRSFIDIIENRIKVSSTTRTTGVLLDTSPKSVPVELGITNDDSVEIISGIDEGQQYVLRIISSQNTTQNATQSSSLFGTGNRSAGGVIRSSGAIPGR